MSTDEATGEDERIRAIVQEELEKQDSQTSGTVPISRRGLLKGGAALGIGGLAGSVLRDGDSGRVAAQTAAGQVGTDSNRVDVYGNVVDAASVQTGEQNNTLYAWPGEVQQVIDDGEAAQSGPHPYIVKLIPDKDYSPSSEWFLRNHCHLDFNGARMKYSSDPGHDLIFLNNHSRVWGAHIDLADVSTSSVSVFRANTSESASGEYSTANDRGAFFGVTGYVHGGATGITMLRLNDAADAGISTGNFARLSSQAVGTGIQIDAGSTAGYVNSGDYQVAINNPSTGIEVNTTDGGIFVKGIIQAANRTDYYINNTTDQTGPKFDGRLWDPANIGINSLSGPNITCHLNQFDADTIWTEATQETGQQVLSHSTDGLEIFGNGGVSQNGQETRTQTTTGVSTTATAIYQPGAGGANIVTVVGDDQDATNQFVEQVLYIGFGGSTVLDSATRGSPPSRTYSVNGNDLELALASDTFDVEVRGTRIPQP